MLLEFHPSHEQILRGREFYTAAPIFEDFAGQPKELICQETVQNAKWWFFSDELIYRKFWDDGRLDKRIYGCDIPDPVGREQFYLSRDGVIRKCTPATYRLWEHWEAHKERLRTQMTMGQLVKAHWRYYKGKFRCLH